MKTFSVPSEVERAVGDDEVPQRFGRFEVQGLLGKGAMGRVLEAFDPDLERVVALKVVPVDESNLALRERLLAEARIASKLEHPNIVPVYEMGSMEGWLYFAMRRIEGRPLSDVLRGRARKEVWARVWNRRRMLGAFQSLCRAVGYAHSQGVLHQDLKPSNVMLGELGEVQLLDWGIARSLDAGKDLGPLPGEEGEFADDPKAPPWERRKVWGTPGYMSPERIRGKSTAFDPRADIWALGVILFEILTIKRGFVGRTAMGTLMKILRVPQRDPRRKNPDGPVDDDLAEIVMTATAGEVEDRFESVASLVSAMDAYLDGSRRRQRAAAHLADALMLWDQMESVAGRKRSLINDLAAEEKVVPEWAPLAEKRRLIDLRRRIADLEPDRASLFGRAVGAAERAVTEDHNSHEARQFLARAYWSRFLEAEAARDRVSMTYFAERVDEWDDGGLETARRGQGSLSLRTAPSGAEVVCARYNREGLLYELEDEVSLGTTPLDGVPLAMGSYRLILRHSDHEDCVYPVFLSRNEWWDSGPSPVRLPESGDLAEGFVYVAGGPFRIGGDPEAQDSPPATIRTVPSFGISRFPITTGEYVEFLNALRLQDPDAAWDRVPRDEAGVNVSAGQFWERPGPGEEYVVCEEDRYGDTWESDWPVMGVSWHDAVAYAAWRSVRDGRAYSLPTELQWEKAARGVDGRIFPWGDGFDASLCHMRKSREGRQQPESVGRFRTDESVYGVRDLAGVTRDWCGDLHYRPGDLMRPIRGGSWDSAAAYCRLTHRTGYLPRYVSTSFGFRLVQSLTGEDEE